MCGIAGWIDWEKDLTSRKDILKSMKEKLSHRGPDEEGEWYSRQAAFVHRRLIVIDPEGGLQPMIKRYTRNKYVMVYNGELYNTEDIRSRLLKKGYTFNGHSDTEVLLLSYIEWGDECVQYLNGIFAFAVWDKQREKLFIARDRIGVKPLFYAETNTGIVFASEIKSLLCHPSIKPIVDREGMAEILSLGPGRTPGHGIFKDIKELRPGHILTFQKSGFRIKKYWELVSKIHEDSLKETVEKVRYLFTDTVRRQLVSDVPICTLLSGGLDSSAISAVASMELRKSGYDTLNTYSVDYEDNDKYFEKNSFQPDADDYWAKLVSDHIGSKHHRVILNNKELAGALNDAMYARDLPGMADIDVSLYLFSRAIRRDFVVAVSGECADEIFGGYPWYYRKEAVEASTFPWSRRLSDRLELFTDDIINNIKPEEYLNYRYEEALAEVPILAGESDKEKRMRELFYLNLTRWMPTLLDRKDRMSMYTGLEIRVPFCDHRLVEYVWNIPWDMKNYGEMRKGILREALKGILPEDVRTRPKNPYPKTFSPIYYNAVKDRILEIINDNNSPILNLIRREKVIELSKHDGDFDLPWFGQLMRLPQLFAYLIQMNNWLEDYNVQINI
ncbi:MAG: asparagine synthase (glutamine-hydrolyzing) [Halanaerobiaceae bacterium]